MAQQDFPERAEQELAELEPYEQAEWQKECAEYERWLDAQEQIYPDHDWTQEHEHGSG